jgi:hypothetical protein
MLHCCWKHLWASCVWNCTSVGCGYSWTVLMSWNLILFITNMSVRKKIITSCWILGPGGSRPTVKLSLTRNFCTCTVGALWWWISRPSVCHLQCFLVVYLPVDIIECLCSSVGVQFVSMKQVLWCAVLCMSKDLRALHMRTAVAVEMMDPDSEKTATSCLVHNHKPMFCDLWWSLKGIFGFCVVFPEGHGIHWHDSTLIATLKEYKSWESQSQFTRHCVTIMHLNQQHMTVQTYCISTQWMSSALTEVVPIINQYTNFLITPHKWLAVCFQKLTVFWLAVAIIRMLCSKLM